MLKLTSGRPRLAMAVVATAVLGGLAAGIAVARSGSSAPSGPPGVLAKGAFVSVSWSTRGTASLVRDASGMKLRLSKAFGTRRSPDLWVYLARYQGGYKHGRQTEWKLISELHRSWGAQTYDLPASAAHEVGAWVVIFCGECGKISGLAQLRPGRASSA